jgi:enamine deaminase RidA (YjgF/YER057c/UK114 family)
MKRACFNAPLPAFPGMSQVVAVGPWIMVSGQLAMADGKLVGAGDPKAQAQQCFKNIAAVLAEAGAGLADIVKLNCYVTDGAAYPGYAEIKNTLFKERPPTGTTVIVAGLLVPGAVMEIEAVAYRENAV